MGDGLEVEMGSLVDGFGVTRDGVLVMVGDMGNMVARVRGVVAMWSMGPVGV